MNIFVEVKGDSEDTEVDEGEDGGDELGNSDSSDSEIEEKDKWQCESCPERNHPMTRRCRRCWTVRRDWFPPSLNRTSSDPGRIQHETAQFDQATGTLFKFYENLQHPLKQSVRLVQLELK